MTDIEPTSIYTPPRWRVAATYAATDGRTPETIEVECNETGVDGAGFATSVIPALADVAARRHTFVAPPRPGDLTGPVYDTPLAKIGVTR